MKVNAELLGIKKPIEIKVTMAVMRKILKIDLALAKINDTTNKDGVEVASTFVDNLADAEKNVFEILRLNEKQRDWVDNNIEPMAFLDWFATFANQVFSTMMTTNKKTDK